MRRLITIPLSHYCEKARWALERAGVDFVEEPHLPGFSSRATKRAGGTRTTPVLVAPEGVFDQSAAILRYADARAPAERRLVPLDAALADEHEAFERELDDDFGPHVRRLAYGLLLDRPALLVRTTRGRVPAFEHLLFRALRPLFLRTLVQVLKITPAGVERSRARVLAVLDRTDALLGDGRPFLFGEHCGPADLTLAALGAPLVMPAEYPGGLPPLEDCPEGMRAFVAALRARPTGAWILARYRERAAAPPR